MSSLLSIAACSQSQPENIQSDIGKEIILGKTDQLLLSESIVSKENYLKLGLRGPEFPHDHIRNNALREVALIFGSQTGFKSATGSITRALEKHSNNLSVVFDFGKVTTPLEQNRGYVIPPVIIKATDAVSLNHEHTILSSTPPPFDTLAARLEAINFSHLTLQVSFKVTFIQSDNQNPCFCH